MTYRLAFLLSIIIHLIPFYLLRKEGDSKKTAQQMEKIKEFTQEKSIKIRIVPARAKNKVYKNKPIAKESTGECLDFYYGLGYSMRVIDGWCYITDIAPNGPVSRFGFAVGDSVKLDDNRECPGRGEDNTEVLLFYKKESGELGSVTLKREKICTVN